MGLLDLPDRSPKETNCILVASYQWRQQRRVGEMVASVALLFAGIAGIAWGAWGDFVSGCATRLVELRLEFGIAFLSLSLLFYLVSGRKKRKHPPLN